MLWAALATSLLAAAASAACWRYGDSIVSYFKPTIERLASEATGLSVSFSSGSVKLFPYIRVVLREGSLISPQGCSPWSVQEASFRIRILPLLQRQLDVASVKIAGVRGTFAMSRGALSLASSSGSPCEARGSSQGASPAQGKPPAGATTSGMPLGVNIEKLLLTSSDLTIFGFAESHSLRLDEVSASVRADAGGLTLPELDIAGAFDSVPIIFDLHNATASSKSTVFAASGEIGLGDQRIEASGRYDRDGQSGQLNISLKDVSLGEDERLFGDSLPPIRGTASGALAATIKAEDISISGDISLRGSDVRVGDSFSAREVRARELAVTLKDRRLASARANIIVEKFHCVDGSDAYSADRVDGTLSLSQDGDTMFSGALSIAGFGFKDEDTTITKATALLEGLSGTVSAQTGTSVKVSLNASSIYLVNPNIIVNSVSSVTAPLTISVPAAGGYSVSGPVTIAGGVLTLQGRKLEQTGGTIQMLVSSPLKDFRSSNLSTVSSGQQISGKTHFAMTRANYTIRDTSFALGEGTFAADLSLGRQGVLPFTASVQASTLPVAGTYRALMQEDGAPIDGSIQSFSAKISGERKDLKRSLVGEGSLLLSNAVIQTVDIQQLIRKAIAAIPLVGTSLVPKEQPLEIHDGSIAASFAVKDAQVTVPDLEVEYSNLQIQASLTSGFDSSLKGTAKVIFLQETFRLLGFGFDKLGNFLAREGRVAIPLTIGRTISDPSVEPDMQEIGKFVSGVDLVESIASGVESLGE